MDLSAGVDSPPEGRRTTTTTPLLLRLLLILSLALVLRLVIIFLARPQSDVFYVDTEAARAVFSGHNPYDYTFTSVPPSLATPGSARVFPYLPLTLVYLLPFYLLGDVRVGLILADLVIGACIYSMRGRWSLVAAAIFLFNPYGVLLSTVDMNNLLIGLVFVSIFAVLEKNSRGSRAGAVSLGLAMASSQLTWLIFPFAAYRYTTHARRWQPLLIALLTGVASVLPFLVLSPSNFFHATLSFQFLRPTLPFLSQYGPLGVNLNPALSGITLSLFKATPPSAFRILVIFVALPFFLRKSVTYTALLFRASLFAILAVLVLPNNFFLSYAELPLVTILLYIASTQFSKLVKE